MTTTPKVSILIPCYNSERFIAETLDSCLAQTYSNIEIIIVDDGSTDRSLAIARENYESKDRRVRVISQPNTGACKARNNALDHSSGEYVMFLDADNIISTNKIEVQLARLMEASDETAVATCPWDRFHIDINEATFPKQAVYRDYDLGFDMLLDLWNCSEMFETACYLLSRTLALKAGKWDESLLKNQDGEYFSRVLMFATKVLFCPEARLYYRTGEYDSVSKSNSKAKIESYLKSLKLYKKNALAHEDSKRVKNALAHNFSLFMYLHYGQYPDLCQKAKQELLNMNMRMLPSGTKRTKIISKLIGAENFLKLRQLILNR